MSLSSYLAAKLLDHVHGCGSRNYTPPAHLYIGLSSSTPAPDGTGVTEPVGGSYARVSSAGTDWASAVVANPSSVQNATVLTFPTPTLDWLGGVNLVYFVVYDAPTGGNLLFYGALANPKAVHNGDGAPSFAIAGLLEYLQ